MHLYHLLHGGTRDQELHLLRHHRCCGLLLDEVVASVDFQLCLQMRRWVKVLTVLSCTPTLRQERSGKLSISVVSTGQKWKLLLISLVKKTPILLHSSQKSLNFSKSQRSQIVMTWTAICINFIALYSYYLTTIDSLYTVNTLITFKKYLNQHRTDTTTYMKTCSNAVRRSTSYCNIY